MSCLFSFEAAAIVCLGYYYLGFEDRSAGGSRGQCCWDYSVNVVELHFKSNLIVSSITLYHK